MPDRLEGSQKKKLNVRQSENFVEFYEVPFPNLLKVFYLWLEFQYL